MVTFSHNRSLMYLEDLSSPGIQVVVVRASMACSQCRRRVSMLLSRMSTGLIEYTVDVRGKQVIFKGETQLRHGRHLYKSDETEKEGRNPAKKLILSSFFLFTCCCFSGQKP